MKRLLHEVSFRSRATGIGLVAIVIAIIAAAPLAWWFMTSVNAVSMFWKPVYFLVVLGIGVVAIFILSAAACYYYETDYRFSGKKAV